MAMTETVRGQLLSIHDQERGEARCKISTLLYAKGKELTAKIDGKIDEIRREINSKREDIRGLETRLGDCDTAKSDVLKVEKLGKIGKSSYRGCSIEEQHPELVAFDLETRELRKEILNRK